MQIVINISTDPQISTLADLKRQNPNTSIPRGVPLRRVLDHFDAAPLTVEPQPPLTGGQTAELGPLEQVEGEWVRRWTVRGKTPAEQDAEVEAVVRQITDDQEALVGLALATLDLVYAAVEGQLAGRTKDQIWPIYRQRIADRVREKKGFS